MQRLYGWSVPQNLSPWRFSCSSLALPSCQLCSSNMMSKPNNPSEGFLMFEDMRQTQAKQPTCTSFTSFIFLRCPVWHHKDQDNLMGQNEHLFDSFSRGADDANNTSTVNYAHVLAFSHSRHKAGPLSLTLWLCFVPHAFSSLCGQAWSKRAVQMPTFHVFFELHMMFSRRHWRHSSKHCHRVALLFVVRNGGTAAPGRRGWSRCLSFLWLFLVLLIGLEWFFGGLHSLESFCWSFIGSAQARRVVEYHQNHIAATSSAVSQCSFWVLCDALPSLFVNWGRW